MEIAQVVKMLPCWRKEPVYHAYSVPWQHKEPGPQQPLYWPNTIFSARRVNLACCFPYIMIWYSGVVYVHYNHFTSLFHPVMMHWYICPYFLHDWVRKWPSHYMYWCWLIIPLEQRSCWGVYWFHSVRLSVRLSRLSCPLCNIYSSGWILSILATNDHYHERVCRTQWPLTLTYIFKVIRPWLRKSCPLCSI